MPLVYPMQYYYYTRSGVDDLSDEELSDNSGEKCHQGSDNEATCTKLLPSTEKVEINSNEVNSVDNSTNASPVVSDEKTEDDSKSTSSLPEISKDENKDENVTEVNGSSSEPPVKNTTTSTIDTFEVS